MWQNVRKVSLDAFIACHYSAEGVWIIRIVRHIGACDEPEIAHAVVADRVRPQSRHGHQDRARAVERPPAGLRALATVPVQGPAIAVHDHQQLAASDVVVVPTYLPGADGGDV